MTARDFRIVRCDRFVTVYEVPPMGCAGDAVIFYRVPADPDEHRRALKLYANRYGQTVDEGGVITPEVWGRLKPRGY